VRQTFDVEAAGRDFRRDQDVDAPGLEVVQRPDSLALALVAMDGGGRDAILAELLGEPVGGVFRPREDQRLVESAAPDEVTEKLALAFPVYRVDDLANQLDRGVAARDLDVCRIGPATLPPARGSRLRRSPRTAGSGDARG